MAIKKGGGLFGAKPPRALGAPKPIKKDWPKNPFAIAANRDLALRALANGVCLAFRYHDCQRIAEVHTVGITRADHPAMSAFQVAGQSESDPAVDWRLFCFDECFDVALSNLPSTAPRPHYKKGAKQFKRIDAEV